MSHKIVLSIIIATYNCENNLKKTLASIKRQSVALDSIEIIVVDGGSKDNTVKIAKQAKCVVIHNPNKLPSWAKYIGYKKALGKYIMFLDSDEVIANNRSIERKLALFHQEKTVKAVTGSGYQKPPTGGFINQYLNEFGDPFSFFIYRLSKDYRFYLPAMNRKYPIVKETSEYLLYNFKSITRLPITELVAMGSVIDADYTKKHYYINDDNFGQIWHFFHLLISHNQQVGFLKNDTIIHYSTTSLSRYQGKIRSRIITNLYTSSTEGFNGRNSFNDQVAQMYKYLFIPYSFLIIFPLFDALYLSITRKNLYYLLHLYLCLYTSVQIVYYSMRKLLGLKLRIKTYGQQEEI